MDVNISVEKRHINPQKIAVTQYESGTTTLKFNLDAYKVDQIDLRNYKAYAVTSINGYVDMVELTKAITPTGITLTWELSEKTLRYAGAITYKIVFKSSEKDDASVFNTYNAIIQNCVSIDADDQIVADVPSVLKQHFDLMQTLSGAFGAEVVYMPVGGSIPYEERLASRLYYQWLSLPKTSAKCATGIVNLGERPYADSGLYINDVHVYVDNTADEAYAIEPDAWVDAINGANCGVTAIDVSSGNDIILLLSAKDAGSAGNNITLSLGLAQYGEGKGKTNPSDGHVSGTRLTGGSDAQGGVDYPEGRFEDNNGNVLSELDNTIGEIKYFAHNKPLGNWLLCDGSAVSRSEYARLYNLIGTTWGEGDGSTTFNLPNLIGRTVWGGTEAGEYLEAGLPNITGHINQAYYGYGKWGVDGAFCNATRGGYGTRGGGGGDPDNISFDFDASQSNDIYGKSDTVQPPAATLRPFIKY